MLFLCSLMLFIAENDPESSGSAGGAMQSHGFGYVMVACNVGAVAISGGTLMSIRSTGGGAAAGGALLPRLRPTLADVGRAWFGPAPVDERVLRPWVGFSIGGAGFDDARVVRTGRFSLRAGAATGAPPKPHLRSGMGRTRGRRNSARSGIQERLQLSRAGRA